MSLRKPDKMKLAKSLQLATIVFALLSSLFVAVQLSAQTESDFDKALKLYEDAKFAQAASAFKRATTLLRPRSI